MIGKIRPLLGSLLLLLVLLPGCVSTEEQPPAAAPTAPEPAASPAAVAPTTVPTSAATAEATQQVQGARSTPGAPGAQQTGEDLLRDMNQLEERLRNLAMTGPEGQELIQVTEQATDLTTELSESYLEMSRQQREDALAEMAETLGVLVQVVQAEATQGLPGGPMEPGQRPGLRGSGPESAGPAEGAALALTPSPRSPLPGYPQLLEEVRQLRQETREAATRRPARDDLIRPVGEIRDVLLTIRAQVDSMAEGDAAQLLDEIAGTMQDVLELVRTYVQQENQAVPGQQGTPGRLP